MRDRPIFRLPDRIVALPAATFEFSPAAGAEADGILAGEPTDLFRRLLHDQESESVLLAARRVLHAFLGAAPALEPDADAGAVLARLAAVRTELTGALAATRAAHPDEWPGVLRERAPLTLIGGCWLDTVSQPATQPAEIVNTLFGQHFTLMGEGNPQRTA
ncbi:MAG TPA: hypothetical protein VG317_03805, partial [Pseudonocardiaceae bacterium]|nr:hypothetical protein [Pseudonocardiaceae bacterium]